MYNVLFYCPPDCMMMDPTSEQFLMLKLCSWNGLLDNGDQIFSAWELGQILPIVGLTLTELTFFLVQKLNFLITSFHYLKTEVSQNCWTRDDLWIFGCLTFWIPIKCHAIVHWANEAVLTAKVFVMSIVQKCSLCKGCCSMSVHSYLISQHA